jgi:flavin-dependent dehydrogenase
MGEGISFALEYGKFAARAILPALRTKRFHFSEYTETFTRSWSGKKLARLQMTARLFYGRTSRFWFALAARSRHQRSGWEAVRTVMRPPLD